MDAALAQLSHHQASPRVVPPEIHQPLLDIAKQGYDANDVTNWYLSVKRDLHRVETASAQTSYSLTPPFSVCSPVPPDLEVQPSDDGGTSPVERNTGPQAFYETPTNNTILWSERTVGAETLVAFVSSRPARTGSFTKQGMHTCSFANFWYVCIPNGLA